MLLSLAEMARRLGGEVSGDQIMCPGPGHSPQDRSLSVKLDDKGDDIVVHSFAGDDINICKDHVRAELGLPKFEPKKKNGNGSAGGDRWQVLREHIYRDQHGEPYARVCKLRRPDGGVQYSQAHWEAGEWKTGKPKIKLPYRLPQLIAAPLAIPIYHCEGEKDADKLSKLGFVATTASEGASAKWAPELTPHFKDRPVVILPDADKVGRAHAQKVAKALDAITASLKVIDLFPDRDDGSDVSNWIESDPAGSRLATLVREAPAWAPSADTESTDSDTDDDALIAELAALPKLQYEKRRDAAAKQLNVRVTVLDTLVEKERGESEEEEEEAPELLYEHWNVVPADKPVDGDALLQALVDAIRTYVFMSDDQAVATAVWIMFSWVHDSATHSPILFVTSAERDSGKTTLLKVISFLARSGLPNVDISGPALFRSIDKWTPTFIVDEADEAFAKNNDLRVVFNSGWTRGDGVIRCDPDTNEPRLYSTFAPKVLGMKGRALPDTTLSRTIIINMKPKLAQDEATRDFDHLDNDTFRELRSKLMRWADDNAKAVAKTKPETPVGFYNRRRANWYLLLAIAERAGGKWARFATKAAIAIEAVHATFDRSTGVQMLQAFKNVFDALGVDRITSATLIAELIMDETAPWATFNKGKPISARQIARLLAVYSIYPRTIRAEGERGKGYFAEQFTEAFTLYVSSEGAKTAPLSVTPCQTSEINGLQAHLIRDTNSLVTDRNADKPLKENTCHGVTDKKPVLGENGCVCVFCGKPSDGRAQECFISGEAPVWLHPECQSSYFTKPRGG
jgi:putative DNA primase/helicase